MNRRARSLTTEELARAHERRVRVYRAFQAHVAQHCDSPSRRDLMRAIGGKSTSMISFDLASLAERGFLVRLIDSHGRNKYALPGMLQAARAAARIAAEREAYGGLGDVDDGDGVERLH